MGKKDLIRRPLWRDKFIISHRKDLVTFSLCSHAIGRCQLGKDCIAV
jgi:hypothetical protein